MNFNYLFNLTLTFSALDRLHNWTTNEIVFLFVGFFDCRGNHCQKI